MKRKSKKTSDFQTKMTKSVFLYGKPNREKSAMLSAIQDRYASEVNRFIHLLNEDGSMLPVIVIGNRTSPKARAFEKEHRSGLLTSAYSQSAFDMAADHLHNRMDDIRHELYKACPCIFTESKTLFYMALMRNSYDEMTEWVNGMLASAKGDESKKFYEGLLASLGKAASDGSFGVLIDEINTLYECIQTEYKLPEVMHPQVRLVSTLFSLETSNGIEAPYVIAVTDPDSWGKRIEVPLYGSRDALRRLKQYGRCGTVSYTVRRDGSLRVCVPFEKNLMETSVKSYRGVDVGIVDMLHTSDDKVFGSFQEAENFYKNEVEPAFARSSSIRNKKCAIRHFLKTHKDTLPDDVKRSLRSCMDRLDKELRKEKAPYRKKRHYYQMQEQGIKSAVSDYIASLDGDKSICTAIEFLDITGFQKGSKKSRQYLSNFARGQLTGKLIETLNWKGYSFIQVEPAYTSQTCPVCGNVDIKNRSGKRFACTCCGHTDDADHVGALNIQTRGSDDEIADLFTGYRYAPKVRHQKVKELLLSRHNEWWSENMMGCYI